MVRKQVPDAVLMQRNFLTGFGNCSGGQRTAPFEAHIADTVATTLVNYRTAKLARIYAGTSDYCTVVFFFATDILIVDIVF